MVAIFAIYTLCSLLIFFSCIRFLSSEPPIQTQPKLPPRNGRQAKPIADRIRRRVGPFHRPIITHQPSFSRFQCFLRFLEPPQFPSLRFMGMKAAILTNNSGLKSFSAKLGFSVLELDELLKTNELQDIVVLELLKLLGFQEGKVVDDNYFDLIFLHVGAGEKVDSNDQKEIDTEMEYVNGLVGEIMSQAQPGSDVGSRLHLSVVMSYGNVLEGDDSKYSVSKRADEKNSYLSELFPLQSYAMKGGSPRKDVRHHCPMLIAQWQHAVTRKDETQKFSFEDFKEHCGNLTIPADRFLHEIAFKLWKAPKYGA
nr:uncharacterized protein LOC112755931 isoform X2 [Arachis hypogaea]